MFTTVDYQTNQKILMVGDEIEVTVNEEEMFKGSFIGSEFIIEQFLFIIFFPLGIILLSFGCSLYFDASLSSNEFPSVDA